MQRAAALRIRAHDLGWFLGSMRSDPFGIIGTTQADAYVVEDVVGEGGFAVVYRAHHTSFRLRRSKRSAVALVELAQAF